MWVFLYSRFLCDAGLGRANVTRPANKDGGNPEAWDDSLSLGEDVHGQNGRHTGLRFKNGRLCSEACWIPTGYLTFLSVCIE